MIISQIRTDSDGEFFLEIPESEILRLKLQAGDMGGLKLRRTSPPAESSAEIQEYLERNYDALSTAMKYLKDR